jgi:hypothetical protein
LNICIICGLFHKPLNSYQRACRGIKGSGLVFCYFHAVKPSLEEIFERKEADEGIYEAFTRKESIKHNFYFSA